MNIGTAGTWDLKWSGNEATSRWYTTLYSKTGESASIDDPPICNTADGVDMEGGSARTVTIAFLESAGGTIADYVAVYLKGIWDEEWVNSSTPIDSTLRGAWFKLLLGEQITFSLGPEGYAANSHTPLGNCNRGIIEIEIDRTNFNRTASGTFGLVSGGTW